VKGTPLYNRNAKTKHDGTDTQPPHQPTLLDHGTDTPPTSKKRRRPPKHLREGCKPPLKRINPGDPDQGPEEEHREPPRGTISTSVSSGTPPVSPPSPRPSPPSPDQPTDDVTQENAKIHRHISRLADNNRKGIATLDDTCAAINRVVSGHSLFCDDFLILGNDAKPTATNHITKSEGQRQVLKWMLTSGAITEVAPSNPAYLNFFMIEKKQSDQWRPLINGAEAGSRGIQNPSVRFTSSASAALRGLSRHSYRWISDLTNGFHLVRCRASPFATFRADGRVYMLISPAQGLPQSPSACNFIFAREASLGGATVTYADNFGGSAPTLELATTQRDQCLDYMRRRGFSINESETTGPCESVEFLGVHVANKLLTLPPDKRDKLTRLIDEGPSARLHGYYAYLKDLFGTEQSITKRITPATIWFDGARGKYSAAVAKCNSCAGDLETLRRSAKLKDQVTAECDAAILAGVLARKYDCPQITGDALYLKDAQNKSSTRPSIAEIITKKLPPISFVKSAANLADPYSRLSSHQEPICSC